MKKIIFLLLALLVIAGCESGSEDWVKFRQDADGNDYLYNRSNLKKDSANQTVQVWAKEIYSDTGKTVELQARIKDGLSIDGYKNLAFKICLYEIDCRGNRISLLSIAHYDHDGKAIYEGAETREKTWFDIKPDSTSGALQREVCPR